MEQDEIRREMEQIMGQLPLNCQRYLLELARASRKAESYLSDPAAVSFSTGESHTRPQDPQQ